MEQGSAAVVQAFGWNARSEAARFAGQGLPEAVGTFPLLASRVMTLPVEEFGSDEGRFKCDTRKALDLSMRGCSFSISVSRRAIPRKAPRYS